MATLRRSERGAAIIETALTLPLLLLVAVGIFEFGRAFQTWEVMTNAAREGARVAVLGTANPGAAEQRVRDYLKGGGLKYDSTVGVALTATSVSMGGGGNASASKVTVTYPFQFMVLQPVAQLIVKGSATGEPITMTAVAEMRNEMAY